MENKIHRKVGLQSNVKVVISLLYSLFSKKKDVTRAIEIINTVAGNDISLGFSGRITGNGTVLGNVMILDLHIPIMDYTHTKEREDRFNRAVAAALIKEFGALNVGYVSSNPVVSRTMTVRIETELGTQDILNALAGSTTKVEVVA